VTLSGNRDRAWQGLTAFSDVFTCYSSAIAAWLAFEAERWPELLNPGLWLTVTEAGDGLFAFGHLQPGLRSALGLERRGADEGPHAVVGVREELDRSGRAIIAGDGFNLPWHVAFQRRHVPHWFVLASADDGFEFVDPFSCRNEFGWQQPSRAPVSEEALTDLLAALAQDDPVFRLRESYAFGDEAAAPGSRRFQWFVASAVANGRTPTGDRGVAAVGRLARHFRDHGQQPDAYRQADDIWSIARHRAFFARLVDRDATLEGTGELRVWLEEHIAPLALKWSHAAPLIMQATLALGAGRPASSSLPELLDELAERELAAASTVPGSGRQLLAGRV
jgi:hypothetical protein